MDALGFIEVPFLAIAAMVADRAAKAADVRILGFETTGNQNVLVRLQGRVASVDAALEAAEAQAVALGAKASIQRRIARPADGMRAMVDFPNAKNPLYGGRDQFLPTDHPQPMNTNTSQQALGILETQGLTAVLEATDAMLKAANVTLVGKEKIGAAYVTVMVRGDVAAVTAAIETGAKAVGDLGKLIAAHVIARPHPDLVRLLPS